MRWIPSWDKGTDALLSHPQSVIGPGQLGYLGIRLWMWVQGQGEHLSAKSDIKEKRWEVVSWYLIRELVLVCVDKDERNEGWNKRSKQAG